MKVNKKNKFLRGAITGLLHCIITTATQLSAMEFLATGRGGAWFSDAATNWQAPRLAQHAIHYEHPLELPIIFFQKVLSPQDGPVCRFQPTCSAYGRKALHRLGVIKGILLTTDRLVRDNPFHPPAVDPVPED